MVRFGVSFMDVFEAESVEECREAFLEYLRGCVRREDVGGFEFIDMEEV